MTKESDADRLHYCDWIALLGFMKEQDALQLVKGQGLENLQVQVWEEKIKRANLAASLVSGRTGLRPEVRELDSRFKERFEAIKKEPSFPEHLIGATKMRFALVELGKLRSFQSQLNSEYIEALTGSAPAAEDLDAVVKFCLPTRKETTEGKMISVTSPGTNTSALVSENLDFRIVGKIDGEDPNTGRRYTGFGFGFGLPQVSVAEYKGHLFLKNGYHRAYALLKKGHKFLPCLMTSTENLQSLGLQGPGFFPAELLMSDWSPILSDFDGEMAVRIPRRRTRVMITVHAETQIVPV